MLLPANAAAMAQARLRVSLRRARATLAAALRAEADGAALWLAPALLCGTGIYFACPMEPPWGWAVLPLLPLAALALALRRGSRIGAIAAALLLAGCTGFTGAMLQARRMPPWPPPLDGAVTLSGRVVSTSLLGDASRVLLDQVQLQRAAPPGDLAGVTPIARQVRLRLRAGSPAPLPGARVRLRALLSAPSPPALPGGRDAARSAWFSGIGYYGMALTQAEILQNPPPPQPANLLAAWRTRLGLQIRAQMPMPRAAIAMALLCGDGSAIAEPLRAAFAASGLAHILAVAGLHLGMVMAFAFQALRLALALTEYTALRWPTRQIATLGALLCGALYAAISGLHVPVLRSLGMAALAALGLLAGRRAVSPRSLCLAAAAIALAAPASLLDPGFAMSFAAVLALVTALPALEARMRAPGRLAALRRIPLYRLALSSLIAGSAAMPFAAYYFGAAGLWFVPANLLAVPLTGLVILPALFLAVPLLLLQIPAWPLVVAGWGIDGLIWLACQVAQLPGAAIAVGHLPAGFAIFCAAGLCGLCLGRSPVLRGLGGLCGAASAVVFIAAPAPAVVVSAGARAIAVASRPQALLLQAGRPDAAAASMALAAIGAGGPPQPCAQPVCAVPYGNRLILALEDADADPGPLCARAALVVAAGIAGQPCREVPAIDARSTQYGGASAYLGADGVRIVYSRATRSARLWDHAQQTLPWAPAE